MDYAGNIRYNRWERAEPSRVTTQDFLIVRKSYPLCFFIPLAISLIAILIAIALIIAIIPR